MSIKDYALVICLIVGYETGIDAAEMQQNLANAIEQS